MKFKSILIIAVIILVIFIIYLTTLDKKIYYLDLGDDISINNNSYGKIVSKYLENKNKLEKYIDKFSINDYRTTDLIRDIKDNKKINNQTIKNALIKADIITLSIGSNDIYYKIVSTSPKESYKYIDQVLVDIEKLFEILREYCKEDIIMINYYNAYKENYNDVFKYINNKLNKLSNVYDINIVNIENDIKNKTITAKNPNNNDHKIIADKIIKVINKQVFSK